MQNKLYRVTILGTWLPHPLDAITYRTKVQASFVVEFPDREPVILSGIAEFTTNPKTGRKEARDVM